MPTLKETTPITVFALAMGMAIPFLQFGIQLVSAPFYPGYSFLSRDASTLGSGGSSCPSIFNVGSILIGIVTLFSSWGYLRALVRLGVNPILAWMTSLALFSSGLAGINAGVFPLPDLRHTDGPLALLGIGTFLLPVLFPAALWKLPAARSIKAYLVANLIGVLALIPVFTGLIQRLSMWAGVDMPGYQSFLNHYHGLLQRIVAVLVFLPIGFVGYFLKKRIDVAAQ